MSNSRSIFWLSFLFVLLVGVNLLMNRYGGEETRIVRRLTLLRPDRQVSALTLTRPGEPVVRLVKDGGWRLVEPFAGSVDEPVVLRLLDALSTGLIDDVMTDSELLKLGRVRADFQLEKPLATVIAEGPFGRESYSFGIPTADSKGVYATVSGSDAVYVVPTNVFAAATVSLDRFRRRTLFSVNSESVAAFDVKRGAGAVLGFVRDGERWTVGNRPAAGARVRDLLSDIVSATAVDFVWPVGATNEANSATSSLLAVYGLDPDSAVTVTLKCVDGTDRQVSFGIDADDRHVYALAQNGGAIVTVDARLRALAAQDEILFTDSRLFPFAAADVMAFSLTAGDAVYALARAADGDWRLDAPLTAPADATTVGKILDRALALSADDVVADGVRLVVASAAEQVVSPSGLLADIRLADLRSKEILDIDPARVRRLVRTSSSETTGASSVVYSRDRHAWNVDGEGRTGAVSEQGVEAVLSAIHPLLAVRIEKLKVTTDEMAAYGLDAPVITVAVDQDRDDSVRRNILIGSAMPDGSRFATVGSSEAVFVLSKDVLDRLTADFIVRSTL